MICEVCRRTLSLKVHLKNVGQSDDLPHHLDAISLRDAAEVVKCPICDDFWSQLSLDGQRRLVERYGTFTSGPIVRAYFSLASGTSASLPMFSLFLNERLLEVREFQGDDVVYSKFTLLPVAEQSELIKTSHSALNQGEFDLAQGWLRTCQASHIKCNSEPDRNGWNPTRLLDVGTSGDLIKVVVNTESQKCLEYVTLSHAWGNAKFLQLTRHNEQVLTAGIAARKLPKTFQDAIEVTRALGQKYLWIDSLCIKQDRDDLSDWLREASLMHRVYRYGYCNISATGAKDSSVGLFRSRAPELLQLQQIELGIVGPEELVGRGRFVVLNNSFWRRNVLDAHLNTRGWVLQERLLASRVLHFGQHQVLWECRELDAAHSFPGGIPREINASGFKRLDPEIDGSRLRAAAYKVLDRDRRFWAHQLWFRIASAYTFCNLTNPRDKLIAISGIAKYMMPILNDEYVAGMWRRFLSSEILWYITKGRAESRNYTDGGYLAPSWSWASRPLSKVVHNEAADENVRLKVKDVALQYQSEDITGFLTGGYIILEGVLKQINICRRTDFEFENMPSDWYLEINGREMSASRSYKNTGQFYPDDPAQTDYSGRKGNFYAMEGQLLETRGGQDFSMLLLRCESHDKGIFSRVGLHVSLEQNLWEQLMERDQHEAKLPCLSWNKETRLHTIRVI